MHSNVTSTSSPEGGVLQGTGTRPIGTSPIRLAAGACIDPTRSRQGLVHFHIPRQEYHIKMKKDEAQPLQVDSGRTTADDIVQIGDMNVIVKDVGKRSMVFGKLVDSTI